VLPYNDPQQLRDAFATSGHLLAAVILEPVVGNMGCVVPSRNSSLNSDASAIITALYSSSTKS
jgi:acetylornithine/succinyldiaminopimelate/putrescine aminotransferase